MSAECFSRQTLRDLLNQWQSGAIDDAQLAQQAEDLWSKYGVWQNWPRDDKRSITFGALSKMRLREGDRFTRDDVPATLAFLDASYGEEITAWQAWDSHFQSAAVAAR